jgi:hypothetical protein
MSMSMRHPRFRPGDLAMCKWDILTIIGGPFTLRTERGTYEAYVTESIIAKIMEEGPPRRLIDDADLSPYDANSK